MSDKAFRFRELMNASSSQGRHKMDALMELKNEIAEARERKFSLEQISDFLKQVGIEISRDTVRRFCLDVLKEKPHKRASKKKSKDSTQKGLEAEPIKQIPSTTAIASRVGPRPGFRIAGDDL